jgi:hypothetical protein
MEALNSIMPIGIAEKIQLTHKVFFEPVAVGAVMGTPKSR